MAGTLTPLAHGLLLLLLLPLVAASISRLENVNKTRISSNGFAEARTIQITGSRIGIVERDAFSHPANVTDATLLIVDTTIGDWYANDMSSFVNVTITGSTIERLHAGGINVSRLGHGNCTPPAAASHVHVRLTNSTVGTLASGAVTLRAGGGVLRLDSSAISSVGAGALRLSFRVRLRVSSSVFGALSPHALRDVCSDLVTFRSNRLHTVGAYSLRFGSELCAATCPLARLFVRRIRDNVLPCDERLRWLRDAQADCSALPKSVADDYRLFADSSLCGDEGVPRKVAQFLGPSRTGSRLTRLELVMAVVVPVGMLALATGALFGRWCGRRAAREQSFDEEPHALQVSQPLHPSIYRKERQRQQKLVDAREKPPTQPDRTETVLAQPDRIPENDYVPVMRPPLSVPPESDIPPPVCSRPPPKGHLDTANEPLYANLHGARALAGWKN
ncbi:uncharacterized protein LOC119093790 [Pollicipes pollicipes]|uniref:uncharacterized protein LOC119093790 n=1 Tax=Pollicipes pollicipes TaxID=41117 RepID=UPI0018859593|nr:uncharacterized protein LOC119093790 [Pollicipes pollicipes]